MNKPDKKNVKLLLRKLILFVLISLLIVLPASAYSTKQIADAYRENPLSALEQYSGQEMEFSGIVTSCKHVFDENTSLWAVRLNAGEIGIIGYTRLEASIGQNITLRGTCVGFRSVPGVEVVLTDAVW